MGLTTGILVLAASIILIGIATWVHSRYEHDESGRVIWTIVQFLCIFGMVVGASMIYSAIAMPPKVPTEGAGF